MRQRGCNQGCGAAVFIPCDAVVVIEGTSISKDVRLEEEHEERRGREGEGERRGGRSDLRNGEIDREDNKHPRVE
jgi:hypothetical protein